MRTILAGLLLASAACTGSIDDTGDMDPNLPPPTDVKVVVKDHSTLGRDDVLGEGTFFVADQGRGGVAAP